MNNNNSNADSNESTRRSFIQKTTLGAAAVGLSPAILPSVHAESTKSKKVLKVGVIGIGSRGAGAVRNIIAADPDTVIWAVADIFKDRLDSFSKSKTKMAGRVDTDGGKREFLGFDAYQKVIDSGVDIVLLTSTPAFRPLHFEASVAAGKHTFLEKPIALDIPGLKSVIETAKKAQNNGLSVLTGLVWRYTPHLMELHKRLQDGGIGDVLSASSAYSGSGRPNRMPELKYKPASMSDMEWALKFWQSYLELSGDGTLEFMIHGIDRMSWAMGDAMPIKCYASGANIDPVMGSNAWDSYSLRYEYADGRTSDFMGRQVRGTFAAKGDTIIGSKGRAIINSSGASIIINDKVIWSKNSGLGYVKEHQIFTHHIRKGEVYNDVLDKTAVSHAIAIMGRIAANTGQLITNKQLMESKDVFIENIKEMNFKTPFVARKSAIPGKTKFI